MKRFPTLETERLDLVRINHRYDQDYFDIMSDEKVMKYYGIESLKNREEAARIIDTFQTLFEEKRGLRWGIILKESQEFIGTVGLNNLKTRDKKAEIGYELHPEKWRQGYTTEAIHAILTYAFEELQLFRMGAITFPANTASNHLLKKIGFTLEGKLRGYLHQNNRSHDAFVYSMLQSEWKQPVKEAFEIEERLQYKDHLSEIIRKAERDGQFDDLPGKGKPLQLGQDYMNPAEKQLYKTLKDNHILPRWIELGNEIDALKEEIKTSDAKEIRRKKIKQINKMMKEYNLACPPSLQRNKMSE